MVGAVWWGAGRRETEAHDSGSGGGQARSETEIDGGARERQWWGQARSETETHESGSGGGQARERRTTTAAERSGTTRSSDAGRTDGTRRALQDQYLSATTRRGAATQSFKPFGPTPRPSAVNRRAYVTACMFVCSISTVFRGELSACRRMEGGSRFFITTIQMQRGLFICTII